MRRSAALTAVAALLVFAGGAAAKGPDRARVCGTKCRTSTGDQQVYPLIDSWSSKRFVQADVPRPAPYFTFSIDSTRGESGRWLLVWIPSKRLMRVTQTAVPPYQTATVGPYWRPVPSAARSRFAGSARGLRPHAPVRGWRISA